MIDAHHLRTLVVRPTIERLGMWSLAAENLLMGTAAVESHLTYLKQHGRGPALSLWQIEPITLWDIVDRWVATQWQLRRDCELAFGFDPCTKQLLVLERLVVAHMGLACGIARFKYRMDANPLPHEDDIPGLAAYWKRVYNTHLGSGEVSDFIEAYEKVKL